MTETKNTGPTATHEAWEAAARKLGAEPETLLYQTGELSIPALSTTATPIDARRGKTSWQVAQLYEDPRFDIVAEQIKNDLAAGVDAIWLRSGLDHGTRILTPGDLEAALRDAPLDTVSFQLEPEVDSLSVGMSLVAVASARGVRDEDMRFSFGADPIGSLLRRGTLPEGLSGGRRSLVSMALHCDEALPHCKAALVNGAVFGDAGASLDEEVAWSIATGLTYLRWMIEAGIEPEKAANQIVFALSLGSESFAHGAKIRALRTLWRRALAKADIQTRAQIIARSSRANRTSRDPWTNMLRGTSETAAGAFGGADWIAVLPFDVEVGCSDRLARRVARNTQLVLREESQLGHVDDPAFGSYAIESLTDRIARAAWTRVRGIEAAGGMRSFVLRGDMVSALSARATQVDEASRTRTKKVIGVNIFPNPEEAKLERGEVRIRDVEVELGSVFGDLSPDERQAALREFGLAWAREGERVLARKTREAMAAGVDLYSMTVLVRAQQPSLYTEPAHKASPAAPWEALRNGASTEDEPKVWLAGDPRSKLFAQTRDVLLTTGLRFGTLDDSEVIQSSDGVVIARDDHFDEWIERLRDVPTEALFSAGGEPDESFDGHIDLRGDVLDGLAKLCSLLRRTEETKR